MTKKQITHMDLNRNNYANTTNKELLEIWLYQRGLHDLPNEQRLASWEINHRITKTEYIDHKIDEQLFHLRFGDGTYEQQEDILIRMS